MRSWYSRYEQWVLKSILFRHPEDKEFLPRAAAVFLMNLMGFTFSLVFFFAFIVQGEREAAMEFAPQAAWGILMQLAFAFGLIRSRLFLHLFILTVVISQSALMYTDGGIESPYFPWIVVPPIVGYLLIGIRGFAFWSLYTFGFFIFLVIYSPPEPDTSVPFADKALLSYFALFNAQIITMGFTLRTRKQLDEMQTTLSKEMAERQHYRQEFERGIQEEREHVSRWLNKFVGPLLEEARYSQKPLLENLPPSEQRQLEGELEGIQLELDKILLDLGQDRSRDNSLKGAIVQLAQELESGLGLEVVLNVPLAANIELDSSNIHIFRIIQEAIRNISKHAQARKVWLDIEVHGQHIKRMWIIDDGIGFEGSALLRNSRVGMGLQNMEDRAALLNGIMRINSQPGKGTTLEFTFTPGSF